MSSQTSDQIGEFKRRNDDDDVIEISPLHGDHDQGDRSSIGATRLVDDVQKGYLVRSGHGASIHERRESRLGGEM